MNAFCSLLLLLSASLAPAKSALILIDMQPKFLRCANADNLAALLQQQVELIAFAKSEGIPIVVVEFKDDGPTHEILLAAIGSYPRVITIVKNTNGIFADQDAGNLLTSFLKMFEISSLIVSGVNASVCVRQLVKGLLSRGYTIGVSADIVADFLDDFITVQSNYPVSYWWKGFERWDRLRQLFRLRKRFYPEDNLQDLFGCEQIWKKS